MALIRSGNNLALVVVDPQVGVFQDAWDDHRIIDNIIDVVSKARLQKIPVIWVRHSDDDLIQESSAWQWLPKLSPISTEAIIDKQYNSAFEATSLERSLAQLNVSHITLCGAATNWCIRSTAYAALERGYDLTLIKDAHTTESLVLGNDVTVQAKDIIDELNAVMTWVAYPGRSITTLDAKDLSF